MNEPEMMSASHTVYSLRSRLAVVTRYRWKTFTPALLGTLIGFGGQANHVHLLASMIIISTPRVRGECATGLPITAEHCIENHLFGTELTTWAVSEDHAERR